MAQTRQRSLQAVRGRWLGRSNRQYRLLKTAKNPSAEVRIHTEFDSWNNFASKPDTHGWANGINVDYVWVSKSITTLEYETVVKIKDSTLKFVGTVPSDHNMIRATVLIPKS